MKEDLFNEIMLMVIGILLLIVSLIDMRQHDRIKTNEALVNHLHYRLEYQDSILTVHDIMLSAVLEDPYIAEIWRNSIYNSDNQPSVLKCAFNLGIPIDSVTQEQFDHRYLFRGQ